MVEPVEHCLPLTETNGAVRFCSGSLFQTCMTPFKKLLFALLALGAAVFLALYSASSNGNSQVQMAQSCTYGPAAGIQVGMVVVKNERVAGSLHHQASLIAGRA
jgi:hypothetical protein